MPLFSYDIKYIEVLEYIRNHYGKHKGDYKVNLLLLRYSKKFEDANIQKILNNLIEVGYLEKHSNNFFITEKGVSFLEDYKLREIDPIFVKAGKFIRRNFSEALSVIAVIVSFLGLFIQIFKSH